MKFSDTFAYRERLEELDDLLLDDKHFIEDTVANIDDYEYVRTVCNFIALSIAREELVEFGNEDFSEAAFDQFKKTKDRFVDIRVELLNGYQRKPALMDFMYQLSGNVKADKLYTEFKTKNIEVTKVDNTKYLKDKKKPQPEHVYMKDTSLYTQNLKVLENYENNKKEDIGFYLEQNREIRAANVAAQYYAFRRVKEELLAIKDDEFDLPGVDLIYNETQLADKYVKEVKKLTEFKKTVKNNIKQGKFDHESFYEACKSLENKGAKKMTQQELQDFVAEVKKDFNKLKEFMNALPAAWPEWEEHFSEMDVNIPGREEKADFYISYTNQCDEAYSLELLINDLRPYEDVFKKTLKNIVETMEPHIKEYLEKKEINGNEPDSEHNNANKGRENDDFIHLEDSDYSESEYDERKIEDTDEEILSEEEEAEQKHEARIKKYYDDKRAKAEKDKANENPKKTTEKAQPRPRRHMTYTEYTDVSKVRKATKEELLANVEEDVEVLNLAIEKPNVNSTIEAEMRRELKVNQITAKDLTDRINDPKNMERYDRAYNIFNDKILAPDYYLYQLMEKYPDEDPEKPGELKRGDLGYDEKGGYSRIGISVVQMDESSEVNNKEMHYNPNNHRNIAKAMRRTVETLMNSNMGDVFTMDTERFLDFCENNDLIKFFNLQEIDGYFGQQGVFQNPETHFLLAGKNPNSPLMTKFKATKDNPDGLTDEQIDFIMEHSEMFCRMSAAAARIVQYATPFAIVLPDDPALRSIVAHGNLSDEEIMPKKSIFDPESARKYYYGGQRPPQPFGNYERYLYAVVEEQAKDHNFVKALKDHPEIEENGWLNADFSASMTGEFGDHIPLTKEQAILQYAKNPKSVKFELNSFGLRKQPERQKDRSKCNGVLKSVNSMEKILKDIYGSKWNASPEFNKLVENIKELKEHAEIESKRFAPNLHLLSRDFKRVQEQAKTYYDAKITELRGKKPNKLRELRMIFAQKILEPHEPLYKENKLKDMEDRIRNSQKELRSLMNDMESAKPKVAAPREKMLNIIARMIALQTVSTTLKNGLADMDFAAVDLLTSEEHLKLATETVKNNDAMRTVRNDIKNLSKEDLLDKMQDVACSKDMKFCAKGGFLNLYNQVVMVVKDKIDADETEEQRKAEVARKVESTEQKKVENPGPAMR